MCARRPAKDGMVEYTAWPVIRDDASIVPYKSDQDHHNLRWAMRQGYGGVRAPCPTEHLLVGNISKNNL